MGYAQIPYLPNMSQQYGTAGSFEMPKSYPQPQGSVYQSNLSQGQAAYADVMAGYANLLGTQQANQQRIQQGYGDLQGQVKETLGYGGTPWGVAAPGAQAIADTYAQQQGRSQQQLINSGLGNSTILSAVQRGNALDAGKAYGALGAQLAQTHAGYQSQLGLAGLGYANQAQQQNAAVGLNQLGYMGAYHNQGYGYIGGGAGGRGGGGFSMGGSSPIRAPGLGGSNNNPWGSWYDRADPYRPQAPDPRVNAGGRSAYEPAAGDAGGGDWGGYGPAAGDAGGGDWGGYSTEPDWNRIASDPNYYPS